MHRETKAHNDHPDAVPGAKFYKRYFSQGTGVVVPHAMLAALQAASARITRRTFRVASFLMKDMFVGYFVIFHQNNGDLEIQQFQKISVLVLFVS